MPFRQERYLYIRFKSKLAGGHHLWALWRFSQRQKPSRQPWRWPRRGRWKSINWYQTEALKTSISYSFYRYKCSSTDQFSSNLTIHNVLTTFLNNKTNHSILERESFGKEVRHPVQSAHVTPFVANAARRRAAFQCSMSSPRQICLSEQESAWFHFHFLALDIVFKEVIHVHLDFEPIAYHLWTCGTPSSEPNALSQPLLLSPHRECV